MGTSHLVMMGIHSQMSVAAHCVSAVLRKTGGLDCRAFFLECRFSLAPCPERSGSRCGGICIPRLG